MIAKLEKQVILSQKTEALLKEIEKSSKELSASNRKNVQDILPQIEKDLVEIADYCKKTNIPHLTIETPDIFKEYPKDKTPKICFSYNQQGAWDFERKYPYTWYSGIDVAFRCKKDASPEWKAWSRYEQSIRFHHNLDDVQYICSNWKDLKDLLVNNICEEISKYNEKLLKDANKNLEHNLEVFASTTQTLDYLEEQEEERDEV